MQAQTGYNQGMMKSFGQVVKTNGFFGLYKGALSPLIGSGIYRSLQFAIFEGIYTKYQNDPQLTAPIPYTFGIQPRVLLGSFTASLVRSVIESPIEYIKVNQQTDVKFKLSMIKQLYTGFGIQWLRTTGVMATYFMLIDSIRRHFPSTFSTPIGQFLASSFSATAGFWIVWPLEVLKNQIQANTPIPGIKNPTIKQRIQYTQKEFGLMGLYRGIIPGSYRSILANGFSMVVMAWSQKKATEMGLRGK